MDSRRKFITKTLGLLGAAAASTVLRPETVIAHEEPAEVETPSWSLDVVHKFPEPGPCGGLQGPEGAPGPVGPCSAECVDRACDCEYGRQLDRYMVSELNVGSMPDVSLRRLDDMLKSHEERRREIAERTLARLRKSYVDVFGDPKSAEFQKCLDETIAAMRVEGEQIAAFYKENLGEPYMPTVFIGGSMMKHVG